MNFQLNEKVKIADADNIGTVADKMHSEYKMWGNGMALPCVLYVFENVRKILVRRGLDELMAVKKIHK